MSTVLGPTGPTGPAPRRTWGWVLGIAAVTVAVRLPFLTRPLGADEGGLSVIASQWSPGRSLYGNYFVDRPPLLIDVFVLAHVLGGPVALRVLGLLLVATAVALAARIGVLAGGSPRLAAGTAAIFLVQPLFGAFEIDGELVAAPLVLAGLVSVLEAARATGHRRTAWLVVTGAWAAAAVLVKQNEADVLVVALVGSLTFLRRGARPAWRDPLLVGAGAAGLTGLVLLQADWRGTGPVALFEAVVAFRVRAAEVIASSATAATSERLHRLLLALLSSGAPLIVLPLLRRPPVDRVRGARSGPGAPGLRPATAALLAWEVVSVLGGGSYWLHYLINLVPGLVLAVAVASGTVPAAPRAPAPRGPRIAVAGALLCCLVALATSVDRFDSSGVDPAVGWLRDHAHPGDTAVVAFGQADLLADTGLVSPYSELWSLPVRVRDPRLSELTTLLSGPSRPDWVVTGRTGSLGGWHIDAGRAQTALEAHYRLVARPGGHEIYRARRSAEPPDVSPLWVCDSGPRGPIVDVRRQDLTCTSSSRGASS